VVRTPHASTTTATTTSATVVSSGTCASRNEESRGAVSASSTVTATVAVRVRALGGRGQERQPPQGVPRPVAPGRPAARPSSCVIPTTTTARPHILPGIVVRRVGSAGAESGQTPEGSRSSGHRRAPGPTRVSRAARRRTVRPTAAQPLVSTQASMASSAGSGADKASLDPGLVPHKSAAPDVATASRSGCRRGTGRPPVGHRAVSRSGRRCSPRCAGRRGWRRSGWSCRTRRAGRCGCRWSRRVGR